MWSKCNATSIHVYNQAPSIEGVALASGYTSIEQIIDARFLDYKGRTRRPREGEIVVFRNVNGFYAAVQVMDVKDNTQGDDVDELRFRYVIQPDGSDDFSGRICVDSVRVRGFRSLRCVELCDLGRLVVMIGPNGCGKSNVIWLFEMMHRMLKFRRLADFVGEHGGGDDQLFDGSKATPRINVEVTLRVGAVDYYDYRFALRHGNDDRLLFADEAYRLRNRDPGDTDWQLIESSRGGVRRGWSRWGTRSVPRPFTRAWPGTSCICLEGVERTNSMTPQEIRGSRNLVISRTINGWRPTATIWPRCCCIWSERTACDTS